MVARDITADGVATLCALIYLPTARACTHAHTHARAHDKRLFVHRALAPGRCWYSNPQYVNFTSVCNKTECKCPAIEEHLAVGREYPAMCHDDGVSSSISALFNPSLDGRGMAFEPRVRSPNAGADYWECTEAISRACFNGYQPAPDCESCSKDPANWPVLQQAGCTADMVPHVCSADFDGCDEAVSTLCKSTIGQRSACYECLDNHTKEFEMANCTELFAEYVVRLIRPVCCTP